MQLTDEQIIVKLEQGVPLREILRGNVRVVKKKKVGRPPTIIPSDVIEKQALAKKNYKEFMRRIG